MPIDLMWRSRRLVAVMGAVVALAPTTCIAGADQLAVSGRTAVAKPSIDSAEQDAAGSARVILGPGGRDLRLAGDLMQGVSARVGALLATHPEARRIHLTSDGGLVEEGVALGALVAQYGLSTYVPDRCASACTLAFIRGRQRFLVTGGRLGFHAPYETGLLGETLAVDAAPERAAYRDAGIAADFIDRALAVSPDDIWIPDAAGLLKAGVVTDIVDTDRFPDSSLDGDDSPKAAREQVLINLPIAAAVEAAAADRLAAWYRDGYEQGRSESEAIDGLRSRLADHLRHLFSHADDGTIRSLGHATLSALKQAAGGDPSHCGAIAGGDVVVIDETLRRAKRPSLHLTALIAKARRNQTAASAESLASEAATPLRLARRASAGCRPLIDRVRHALTRPSPEAASVLRRMLLDAPQPDIAGIAPP